MVNPSESKAPADSRPERASRWRPTAVAVAAAALFLAAACAVTWPLPLRLSDGLIGIESTRLPDNDTAIFLWDFWWVRTALLELQTNPAYCDRLGQPGPPTFVFPTLSAVNSLAAAALTSVFSLETTYNLLVLLILALNGWATWLLARELGAGFVPALIAGVFLAGLPLVVNHVTQLNILTFFWVPLTLVAGRRWLHTGRWYFAPLTGLCFLATMLSSWYHAITLGFLLVLLGAVQIWLARSEAVRRFERRAWPVAALWLVAYGLWMQVDPLPHVLSFLFLLSYGVGVVSYSRNEPDMRRVLKRLSIGAATVVVFALPVVIPMAAAARTQPWLHDVPLAAKAVFSADLASYVLPAPVVERVLPNTRDGEFDIYGTRVQGTANVFPGIAGWLALLAAAGWAIARSRTGLRWLLVLGVFALLSLGPILKFGGEVRAGLGPSDRIFLPGFAFHYLPILKGLRVLSRFAFGAWLGAAVFIAIQADRWVTGRSSSRGKRLATAALAVFVPVLLFERLETPRPVASVPRPPAFEWLRRQPEGRVLLCPIGGDKFLNLYQNLYAQTQHGQPMVNPYVSRRPGDFYELLLGNPFLYAMELPDHPDGRKLLDTRAAWLQAEWRRLGVRWLVLDRAAYSPEARVRIGDFLTGSLHLAVAFEDERHVVYTQATQDRDGTE